MTNYRIIALDLDGTLTRNDKTVSSYTREVLIRAQQQGVRVVLASGRPTNGMAFIADELQMNRYGGTVLAFNGGEIVDWSTKRVLSQTMLPSEVVPDLYDFAKDRGFGLMTYCGAEIVTEIKGNKYVMNSAFRNRMEVRQVANFTEAIAEWGRVPKCMVVGMPEKLELFEKELHEYARTNRCFEGIDFYRSEPYYLEVVPKGIDKGKCLQTVLDHYGARSENLIACGDAFNDISMIEFAGLGVAMGNANERVKQAADYITESNEADGVAKVVERFMLGE